MSAISIGLSGLEVSQQALNLIGQNITNANTPGYHLQVPDLATETVGDTGQGSGVVMNNIEQYRDGYLESAVSANTSNSNNLTTQLQNAQNIQAYFNPTAGSVNSLLTQVFNDMQQLAAQPSNLAQRQVLLNDATSLTQQFNSTGNQLAQLSTSLDTQGNALVGQANSLDKQIATLNGQIQIAISQGQPTNDLADQRDQALGKLAQLVDVRTVPQNNGVVNVLAGGLPVVVGNNATNLSYSVDASNQAQVTAVNSQAALPVSGGQLAGLLQVRNTTLPNFSGQLNTLANQLAQSVDEVQATGIGLQGPLTSAQGTRAASNVNTPLAQAGLAFPPQQGTLAVSVTNPAGQRTTTQVPIFPPTQSLSSLATSLQAVPGLQTVVADPQTGTLKIVAAPGYGFDFAGRLSTMPDNLSGFTGTATISVMGTYTGSTNDAYAYKVVGSGGTVGSTPGLQLQVTRQSDNTVLGTVDLGPNYTPGTATPAINGVSLQLGAGTLNPGDQFTVNVTAQPDTANILSSLGLNTFFTGSGAAGIAVNPALTANPNLLAASQSGQPGDATNLEKMVTAGNAQTLNGNTQNLQQFSSQMIGNIGSQVQDLTNQQTAAQTLGQSLQTQQQNVSGVDPNQELVQMLNFQRAFQMSAQYISTINTTLNDLMSIFK